MIFSRRKRAPISKTLLFFHFLFLLFSSLLFSQETNYETLKVGVLESFPPQYSLDESGAPAGFAIDIIEYLSREYGFTINYRVYESWSDLQAALEQEEIDLIPNMGITERRMDSYAFSTPVETFPVSIFTRSSHTFSLPDLESLEGKTVAVVYLNVGEVLIKEASPKEVMRYDHVQEALFGLLSGNADALIYPEPVLRKLARQAKIEDQLKVAGPPLVEIKRAMSVLKKNKALLDWLDPKIRAFLETREYSEIYTRWYGVPTPYWTVSKVLIGMSILLVLTVIILLYWKYRSTENLVTVRTEQLSHKAQLLSQVNDGVISLDLAGCILSINPGAEELFLFKKEDIIGKELISFTKDMTLGDLLIEHPHHREIQFRRKDHSFFEGGLSLSPLVNDRNEKIGYVCLIQDISERKALERKREELIRELQDALLQIKTLSGLLPICSHCKKIRDDKGYWNQLESYLGEHSDILFSHSLCPDCMDELYGEMDNGEMDNEE